MLGLERGHPVGGLMIYCSEASNVDCTKAWDTSAVFGAHCFLTAIDRRRHSSIWDRTGAKQSLLDQLLGSRLPRTMRRYLHLMGVPFSSRLRVDFAMVGSAGPVTLRSWR